MSEQEINCFGELLSVLGDEELIRFRHRLRKTGKLVTAEVLALELAEREIAYERTANLRAG